MSGESGLHPELARIRREYQELYDSVQQGDVSEEEARDLLKNITAVDGDGAVWSFDPYTGEFTRALPGLPAQQAAPSMFAPSRLPVSGSVSSDPQVDDGPPMPSLGPSSGVPASVQDPYAFDPDPESPSQASSSRRFSVPERLRPLLRPAIVLLLLVGLASFMLSSREPASEGASEPDVTAPSPSSPPSAPEGEVPSADPALPVPSAPSFTPPLVRFDDTGSLVPLSQEDVAVLLSGIRSAESGLFSAASERWVDAYSLPLLGASAAGWDVAVTEWVLDASGRDRLTIALSKSTFPQQLRWWAFVEPQGGFWLVSELHPLPSS